jgi:hypothetical protein
MAIGSGAEIGVVFGRWGDMTPTERDLWCATFRPRFGADLLGGYATLVYPKRKEADPDGQTEDPTVCAVGLP